MKKQLLFLVLGIAFLSSCQKITTNTTDVLPSPTGTIEGFVTLYNEFGNNLYNSSGVTVSIDSTSITSVTDSNGRFFLKNVPANTHYNFTFTKTGYNPYHYLNFQYTLAGGTAPLYVVNTAPSGGYTSSPLAISIKLYQTSSTTVTSLKDSVSSGSIIFTCTVTNNSAAYKPSFPLGAQVFISTKKNVSQYNYQYTTTAMPGTNPNIVTAQSFDPSSSNYPIGTTLYFTAYGFSGNYEYDYQNIANGLIVFPGLNSVPLAIDSAVTQ